jgi:polysaccharide biosynthesis transport protein
MDSEQYPQMASSKVNGRLLQWLPLANSGSASDADEGGLNLGQIGGALRRRLPVIAGVTTVVTSLALLKALTSTPTYQANFEILTKPVTVESQVISSVPQSLSSKEGQQAAPEKGLDQTKLKLLRSPRMLEPIAKSLKYKYPDLTYEEIFSRLVVTPLPNSEILTVTYQDKDRDKVKSILKLVSDAYLSYSLEERLADVQQGIEFVDTQLPLLQDRVSEIQDRLQRFRQEYSLIDPESSSKELAAQTSSVGQQRVENQIKLSEARALSADLGQQLAERAQTDESVASSAVKDNPRYQALMNQILAVESDIAKQSVKYTDEAPNLQALREQQDSLEPLARREGDRAQAEVESRIRELEARDRILLQTQNQLNQRVKQLSVTSRQYADIQQGLKIATENLNQFLTKREALRIDAGQRKTPWQILTSPTEPIPSSADVKKTAVLGGILGLLLGVAAAILLDRLSNVLHTPEEIKETSKLPMLGVIPFNSELEVLESETLLDKLTSISDVVGFVQQMSQKLSARSGDSLHQYASSPFLESFRSLYANIRLLNSDTRLRSIVISSSTPGEGKSTISIYLAQAAAALGQRVLLVDTDLRLPQLHHRLGLNNSYGLSNVIATDLPYDRMIQQSLAESNLYVLTAGSVPPDPTKLLSSQKMQLLMEQFKNSYDLVIYDTPPLLGLADTKLISSRTDGIVMVVSLNKTKSAVLSQALDGLKQFSVSVIGIVANGSKDHKATHHDPYHRYYNPDADDSLNWDMKPVPPPDR